MNEKGSKNQVRKEVLFNRRLLDAASWNDRNTSVCMHVSHLIEKAGANAIHVFLPIAKNKEVNLWTVIHNSHGQGKQIVVSATDFKSQTMSHFEYQERMVFEKDRFGIPTPRNGSTADLRRYNLC